MREIISVSRYQIAISNARRILLFVVVYLALLNGRLQAQVDATSTQPPIADASNSYTLVTGVPYAKGLHGDLLADLYLPKSVGLHPAVLYIHGGGWSSGDRGQLKKIAIALAGEGYVGVAIDYDLTVQGARFPVALIESKSAVRWMRSNATLYNIDPKRIATMGSSAGGELAAEVGLTADKQEYEKGENLNQSSAVEAAVVLNGVLDLSDLGTHEGLAGGYFGNSCAKVFEECKDASPVFQVHPGAPPFFVGHGTADQTVPYRQAQLFIERLKENRVPVTAFVAEGAGHTYWANSQWYKENLEALKKFFTTIGFGQPTAQPAILSQAPPMGWNR